MWRGDETTLFKREEEYPRVGTRQRPPYARGNYSCDSRTWSRKGSTGLWLGNRFLDVEEGQERGHMTSQHMDTVANYDPTGVTALHQVLPGEQP